MASGGMDAPGPVGQTTQVFIYHHKQKCSFIIINTSVHL